MLWGIGPGIYASWLIVMGWDLRLRQIQDIPRLLRSGIVTFDDDVGDDLEVWRGHKKDRSV